MSKQLSKGYNDQLQTKPLNNIVLIQQLKAAIVNQCYPLEMSKKAEGCLEFVVRGGELGINYISDERDLSPESYNLESPTQNNSIGMSRKGLKTMLFILESVLQDTDYIDYATILVYYSVAENGEYATGKLSVRRGIHHPRY